MAPLLWAAGLVGIVIIASLSLVSGEMAAADGARKPHILLMVLDDIGRTDTGVYGASNIPMPNLVSMAKSGVVLDNFYTQTVCSPTRSALLTGQYPFRFGMQHFTTQLPAMIAGVPLNIPMLPKLLEAKGYERHMVGKWHCGYATWGHTPPERGFQTYTGYLQAQGDYYKHNFAIDQAGSILEGVDGLDFWKNERAYRRAVGNYSLDLYRQAMSDILTGYVSRQDTAEKRAEHPLFVYLAHQTVHIPLQFRNDEAKRCGSIKHSTRKIYCNMMVELDDALGEMIAQYRSLGLYDDLIILAMTDNGGMVNFAPNAAEDNAPIFPASQGSNFPLRGSKTTMFEGGVRSMAFVSGGFVPSNVRGTKFAGLAHVVDFSATVLSLAGVLPLGRESLHVDGFDLTNLLFIRAGAVQQRDHVPINVVSHGKRYSAVRFGKYKVIVDDFFNPNAQGWFDKNGDLAEAAVHVKGKMFLFDLEADPEERKDLVDQYPQILQHGLDLLQMYVKGGRYMEPQDSTRLFVRAMPIFHGGTWRPFMSEKEWIEHFEEHKAKQQQQTPGTDSTTDDDVGSMLKSFTWYDDRDSKSSLRMKEQDTIVMEVI